MSSPRCAEDRLGHGDAPALDRMPLAPPAALRLVLDTNVWLDLLVFSDLRCAALRAALADGRVCALLDAHCHAEWRRVLAYPLLRLDEARQAQLMEAQRAHAVWIESADTGPQPAVPLPRCRDDDDQKFLQLAESGEAHALLSRDQALLELDRRLRRQGRFAVLGPEGFDDWLQSRLAAGTAGI